MAKRTAIKDSSLPMRSPIWLGLLWWIALDYFKAPGWAWGVVGTVWGLVLIAWIIDFCTTAERDVPGFGKK